MELRAFGICSQCSELHPASRGCPVCDGDREAAREIAEASLIACATESPARHLHRRRRRLGKRLQAASIVAVLGLSLFVGTLVLMLSQA